MESVQCKQSYCTLSMRMLIITVRLLVTLLSAVISEQLIQDFLLTLIAVRFVLLSDGWSVLLSDRLSVLLVALMVKQHPIQFPRHFFSSRTGIHIVGETAEQEIAELMIWRIAGRRRIWYHDRNRILKPGYSLIANWRHCAIVENNVHGHCHGIDIVLLKCDGTHVCPAMIIETLRGYIIGSEPCFAPCCRLKSVLYRS